MLYASQLLQAEAIRYGVEHWRRNRGRCMGAIVLAAERLLARGLLGLGGRLRPLEGPALRRPAVLRAAAGLLRDRRDSTARIYVTNDPPGGFCTGELVCQLAERPGPGAAAREQPRRDLSRRSPPRRWG